jgi:hypothetical protein
VTDTPTTREVTTGGWTITVTAPPNVPNFELQSVDLAVVEIQGNVMRRTRLEAQ